MSQLSDYESIKIAFCLHILVIGYWNVLMNHLLTGFNAIYVIKQSSNYQEMAPHLKKEKTSSLEKSQKEINSRASFIFLSFNKAKRASNYRDTNPISINKRI
jgi:hypothetical protein